ncbi:MAG: 6-bladed beta-propeller [Acidobacteriota bacterium]
MQKLRCFSKIKILSFIISSVIVSSAFEVLLADDLKIYEAKLEEVAFNMHFTDIQKIIPAEETIFVLEMKNHRIIFIKDKKIIGQIGKIGNGKGEFYYPSDFFIDKHGLFYVLDKGNYRIQILDSKGIYLSDFPDYPESWGLAVNSKGEILLGQPALNNLVSVYNPKGKRLRSFGSLINPSEIYGMDYKKYNETHKVPLNRIRIALDENDNAWLVFLHAPLICKYNQKGELIYKKILNIPDLQPLKKAIWQSPPPYEYASINIDGIQLTMIIRDITFDPKKKQILILLGDQRIVAFNSEANEQFIIKPKFKEGSLRDLSVNKNGEIFVSIFFSPKCYKLILSSEKEDKKKIEGGEL